MELWLLGAGAIVLIGITLWIVWPARTADLVGTSVQGEEVSDKPMTETVAPGPPLPADRYADQYTSATADLSAGGVAVTLGELHDTPDANPTYDVPVPIGSRFEPPHTRTLTPQRSIGMGAAVLLLAGGGIGGAWLYARWQRERNKPINRLRRGARGMATRLGDRMPDVDELPAGAAPMSGAATALLLAAIVASRALRHDSDDAAQDIQARATEALRESLHEARERGEDAVKRGRKESRKLQARVSSEELPSVEARKPAVMGIGLGGLALVAGGAYAVWRLMRRGQPDRSAWYAGD
jgi:hypothetical protein